MKSCRYYLYHSSDLVPHDCYYWDLLPAALNISHNLESLVLEDVSKIVFKLSLVLFQLEPLKDSHFSPFE